MQGMETSSGPPPRSFHSPFGSAHTPLPKACPPWALGSPPFSHPLLLPRSPSHTQWAATNPETESGHPGRPWTPGQQAHSHLTLDRPLSAWRHREEMPTWEAPRATPPGLALRGLRPTAPVIPTLTPPHTHQSTERSASPPRA